MIELLDWMSRAGCVGVFIGLEFLGKAPCVHTTRESSRPGSGGRQTLHRKGMVVEAGLIFGFDSDSGRSSNPPWPSSMTSAPT